MIPLQYKPSLKAIFLLIPAPFSSQHPAPLNIHGVADYRNLSFKRTYHIQMFQSGIFI